MNSIYVPDIGDGLSCSITTATGDKIHIDCGSQNNPVDAFNKGVRMISPDYFILSHFHSDHYNGLFEGLKQKRFLRIKQVIFPVIPEFSERIEFLRCMMAMNHRVLGDKSGSMEYDFLRIMQNLNVRSFKYQTVAKGDHLVLGGMHLDVLWPPRILEDERVLKSVREAIEDFNNAKENDEILKDIYEYITKADCFDPYPENIGEIEHIENKEEFVLEDSRESKDELPEVTKKANKSLRNVANRLSLAFHSDSSIIFMGDLRATEINNVVEELEKKDRISFKVMLTPHHGTHWGYQLSKIFTDIAISSVGSGLLKYINPKYKSITPTHLLTYLLGDIYLSNFHTIPYNFLFWRYR